MSGGSFNYLCSSIDNDWSINKLQHQIKAMAVAIREYGPEGTKAAEDSELILKKLDEVTFMATSLSDVWHAVEWHHSCDWSKEDVMEALDKYKPDPAKESERANLRAAAIHLNGLIQGILSEKS